MISTTLYEKWKQNWGGEVRNKSLWTTFWAKVGGVSIRTKVMGIVAACIAGSAIAVILYTFNDDLIRAREQLQERGIAIGTSIAAQSQDLILTDSQFSLYELIRETGSTYENIDYVFVLDGSGNVLVHNFDGGFPIDLLDKNEVPAGEPYHVQALQADGLIIQDVAVPVLGGKAGVIRLGMSEATLSAGVTEHVGRILVWVLLVLLLGLVIAYAWTSFLTNPVSQLSKAVRVIGKGDFEWKAPVWARDEIGDLGTAFNEMSAELQRKEIMREQLLAKIMSTQEDERKRISRELHDETSQALASLKVGLRLVEDLTDPIQIKEKLTELRTLVAQTLETVHQIAVELRPNLLDDVGLVAAIKGYVEEYSAKVKIKVDFHASNINEQHLSAELRMTVYRIVQEALTNIAKHAEASSVSVVLRSRDSSLVTIVEDNGKGFELNRVMDSHHDKKLGLFGMYERASLVGGRLTIESNPDVGTTVFFEVPVPSLQEIPNEQDKVTSG
jgi:signal transduction histidine kinase